jgi:23S rRNA (uridine2552-2'-O)-methyltransferase
MNLYKRPDSYAIRAKKNGYRSRAAWKLIEIDDKHHITKNVHTAIDLGCAPGSWLQVLKERINGHIVGIDITQTTPIPGITILKGDICDPCMIEILKGYRPQLIVSDMAPNTTGDADLDHRHSIHLSYIAIELVDAILSPGGKFLCKVFGGSEENKFFTDFKSRFTKSYRIKPSASKSFSKEFYLLGIEYKR